MKKIRIGNDLLIEWAITMNGLPYNLNPDGVRLYVCSRYARTEVVDFKINANVLSWTFYGKDQAHTGTYSLLLVQNNGLEGMITADVCEAFELVARSCFVGGKDDEHITTASVSVESSLILGGVTHDEFEKVENDVRQWKDKNVSLFLDSLVVVTPELGQQSVLDVMAFRSIVEKHQLEQKAGIPLPCLFKRETRDLFHFGSMVFSKSSDGKYQRMDITYSNGLSTSDMSNDEILWAPDCNGVSNIAYLYDVSMGFIMTLGVGTIRDLARYDSIDVYSTVKKLESVNVEKLLAFEDFADRIVTLEQIVSTQADELTSNSSKISSLQSRVRRLEGL